MSRTRVHRLLAGYRDVPAAAMRCVMPLFRKSPKNVEGRRDEPVDETACPHTTLIPRWDNAADVGNLDRATRFLCEGCNTEFDARQAAEGFLGWLGHLLLVQRSERQVGDGREEDQGEQRDP